MKVKKTIFYFLMFFPIFITLVFYEYLPKITAAHYNIEGVADRYGSRMESFILPVVIIAFSCILILFNRKMDKTSLDHNITLEIVSLLTFNILCLYDLYGDLSGVFNLRAMPIQLFNLAYILVGFAFIVDGNLLPKSNRHPITGFIRVETLPNGNRKKIRKVSSIFEISIGILFLVIGILTKFSNMTYFLLFNGLCVFLLIGFILIEGHYS